MILWEFTLEEARPFFEHRKRDLLFREAVIAFLTGGKKQSPEDRFCEACRAAGKDKDCESCDRKIEVLDATGRAKTRHLGR